MKLTTRDLGVQVEEWTHRSERRFYAVDGLPDGVSARIFEEDGSFSVSLLDVAMEVKPRRKHPSMLAALEELCSLLKGVDAGRVP